MLGAVATKVVATWIVDILYFMFKLGVWGQDCLSAVAKKTDDKEKLLPLFF